MRIRDPARRRPSLGIATVYQDLALAENLDVVANLFLGQEIANTIPGVHGARRDRDGAEVGRAAVSSLGVTTLRSVRTEVAIALRRPAPGRGDRPLAARRAEGGDARRADRGAGHRPDRADPEADRAAAGPRPRRDRDQPQPRQRLRGLPTGSRSCASAGWRATFKADDTTREQIVASITGADVKERATEETPL